MGRWYGKNLKTFLSSDNTLFQGVTASATEVNVLDGIAATLTADELNILDGVTATAAEINKVAGVTGGAVIASKAVVTNANAAFQGARRVVEAHTALDTLAVTESGSIHTNEGAGAAFAFTLPAAVVGLEYLFYVMAAQELRIDPNGTETISGTNGAQGAAGKYIGADAVGEFAHVVCVKAGQWEIVANRGTWTHES